MQTFRAPSQPRDQRPRHPLPPLPHPPPLRHPPPRHPPPRPRSPLPPHRRHRRPLRRLPRPRSRGEPDSAPRRRAPPFRSPAAATATAVHTPRPGGGWEAIQTPHTHDYAPFDLRLFAQREGCYHFIGDPRDFGYTGQVYNYYGAHPVHDTYGGGWCFMVGGHYHWWRPWSPYFTVVGPWFYWHGAYDPFFWSYWPYYSFYYRSYYPSYYAGGRYYRNGYRVAPPNRARSSDRMERNAARRLDAGGG